MLPSRNRTSATCFWFSACSVPGCFGSSVRRTGDFSGWARCQSVIAYGLCATCIKPFAVNEILPLFRQIE
jgi:hypothetical protein